MRDPKKGRKDHIKNINMKSRICRMSDRQKSYVLAQSESYLKVSADHLELHNKNNVSSLTF